MAPGAVRVLDADPDLGASLAPGEWSSAAQFAIAPAFELEPGPWRFFPPPDPSSLGALILEGMIVVRIAAGARAHVELLGEGDVISPWVGMGTELAVPSVVSSQIVSKLRIALLDRRFALRTARWPEIHGALVQRLITRTRRVSLQSAINSLPRIEERLELTLWEVAHRFGRVTPEGITVVLPLTHSQLADMVAAQRPSVSTALASLQRQGRVQRMVRHKFLLSGSPPSKLSPLAVQSGLRR